VATAFNNAKAGIEAAGNAYAAQVQVRIEAEKEVLTLGAERERAVANLKSAEEQVVAALVARVACGAKGAAKQSAR
jgi:hypothetical protein